MLHLPSTSVVQAIHGVGCLPGASQCRQGIGCPSPDPSRSWGIYGSKQQDCPRQVKLMRLSPFPTSRAGSGGGRGGGRVLGCLPGAPSQLEKGMYAQSANCIVPHHSAQYLEVHNRAHSQDKDHCSVDTCINIVDKPHLPVSSTGPGTQPGEARMHTHETCTPHSFPWNAESQIGEV
jgi:hypothetical protein